MTSGEFATYAVSQGCEILQEGTAARVIRLHNPTTKGNFNIGIYDNLYLDTISKACTRLGIPFPPKYL